METFLPTPVTGSWSVPDRLERATIGVHHGAVSRTQLAEMHDMAVKAPLTVRHLPAPAARAKLRFTTSAAAAVRRRCQTDRLHDGSSP